jgi:tripartite-type tricarboxylate transporter receptor subunit TctC
MLSASHRILRIIRAVFICIWVAIGTAATAQDYPNKPVRIVVPFAPGGVTDNSARVMADRLGQRLGQPVIVENRAGANGNIGTGQVAQAAPDGYTLLLGFDGTLVINPHIYPKMPFDVLKDFAPVSKIGDGSLILVAHTSVPASTLKELVALSKQKPGAFAYGTAGTGSTSHAAAELLKTQTGLEMTHVPYKGAGPAVQDLVAGQIPLAYSSVAGAAQFIRQGRIRGICVSSAKRDGALSDVPTCAESGAPGHEAMTWTGILVPAKTPRPIIERLNREMVAVLSEQDLRERYATLGIYAASSTPEQLGEVIRADLGKWARVVKQAGMKLE